MTPATTSKIVRDCISVAVSAAKFLKKLRKGAPVSRSVIEPTGRTSYGFAGLPELTTVDCASTPVSNENNPRFCVSVKDPTFFSK